MTNGDRWIVGNPRRRWPRERDFTRWLADHLDQLAPHLGVQRLEYVGREVVIGERWEVQVWANGQEQTVGGLRVDLRARDERGRDVIIEAQFGPADHTHFGQLVTYAFTAGAALAVWMVIDADPVFCADHLATLARLNTAPAGWPQFHVVAVTVETRGPLPVGTEATLLPRLHQIDLRAGKWACPEPCSHG
jgi:hypothetical protein